MTEIETETLGESLLLSLKVSFFSTLLAGLVGLLVAYFLYRKSFPGKSLVEALFTLPLILPPTVTGYYLILLFGRKGMIGQYLDQFLGWSFMFTWQGAVLSSFVVSLPLMIKPTLAALESVDPTMIESAYTLGYSPWETAFHIILPLSRQGLLAGMILSFSRGLGEFGATMMVAGNIPGKTATLPLTLYNFAVSGEWDKANRVAMVLTLISFTFLLLANKFRHPRLGQGGG